MRTSTANSAASNLFGDEKAFELLAQVGFEAIDYRIVSGTKKSIREDYAKHCEKLKKIAEDNNIAVGQFHAPAPSYVNGDKAETERMFVAIVQSIEAAGILGAPYVVVHPPIMDEYKYNDFKAENKELSMEFYSKILPYAKEAKVKIAIENMWNYDDMRKRICPTTCSYAEEIIDYIDELNDDTFCACLDIGHSVLTYAKPEDEIRLLGDKLKVLHIHDVDGIEDLHTVPYLGVVNWDECCKSLAEIGFSGDINLESVYFLRAFPEELSGSAHKLASDVCKNLRDKVLDFKRNINK